jgi:hypothetical protein
MRNLQNSFNPKDAEEAFLQSFFLYENTHQSCCNDRIMPFLSIGILVIPSLHTVH